MKFKIKRTSGGKPNVGETILEETDYSNDNLYEIEINTLEELLEIKDKAQEGIIIFKHPKFYNDKYKYEIEIYDSRRE